MRWRRNKFFFNICGVVALKRISKEKVVTPQQKQRLEAEKHILHEVTSPFLCRGISSFETEEEVAFLQEYIDGRPLYECVWKYRDTGKFPEHVAKFFAAQLVLALRDLHGHGYVHRDFKSGNVLVDQKGFAKVIDFGLAKDLQVDKVSESDIVLERTQSMCGTHYVMAPEVFFRKPYGFAADWWSLGVVIYEMIAGRPPWEYQCRPGCPLDDYFQEIKDVAASPFQSSEPDTPLNASADLQSLISVLLKLDPHERLGYNGATEVMHHAWFDDVQWDFLEEKHSNDASFVVPYDVSTDFNAARVRTPPARNGDDSSSSAESIDPEDNAKYFADF